MGSFSSSALAFKRLQTRAELADWLGVSDKRLRYLLYALPDAKKYESFSISKRNGSSRRIDAPSQALKQIQRAIHAALVELAPPSGIAKGYVVGRGIAEHAKLHRGKRFVVLADLADFFPSITFPRVRGALMAPPLSLPPEVATCVAQLCCKDGALPQGAPTSPVLSNLICRALDHRLISIGRRYRMSVSRYADDICLSTSHPRLPPEVVAVSGGVAVPGVALVAAVEDAGFALNATKFKVRHRRAQQMVTGLVVNKRVGMPRRWRRQLRVLLHLVSSRGIDGAGSIASKWTSPTASRQGFKSLAQVIRGKANFSKHLDQLTGGTFSSTLFRNYPAARSLIPRPIDGVQFRLMGEGETDLLHIEAALEALQQSGEFYDLAPRFKNFEGNKGDVELLKTLERIANSDIPELTIGVFDCDNSKTLSQLRLAPGGSQGSAPVFTRCVLLPRTICTARCSALSFCTPGIISFVYLTPDAGSSCLTSLIPKPG